MIQNDTSLAADAETTFDDIIQEMDRNHVKICLKIYQTQEKCQQIVSSHVEANLETTFGYCNPEIDRKRAEDMSDVISDTGKISNNYLESFCA